MTLTLEQLDRDEALLESIAILQGETRAGFLRKAALGSAALLTTLATAPEASANVTDLEILQFGLRFERLQATFYTQAEELGTIRKMSSAKQDWARTLGAHERAHVRAFRGVLGSKAIKRPHFDFGGATEGSSAFRRTAVAFEDLAVAAYKGQAPHIRSRAYLASALAIHSVEARHAAWIRRLAGKPPVAGPFDQPVSGATAAGIVANTHFVMKSTSTSRKGPKFTG